jgi:hypothetical protein
MAIAEPPELLRIKELELDFVQLDLNEAGDGLHSVLEPMVIGAADYDSLDSLAMIAEVLLNPAYVAEDLPYHLVRFTALLQLYNDILRRPAIDG